MAASMEGSGLSSELSAEEMPLIRTAEQLPVRTLARGPGRWMFVEAYGSR